jgi:outer membrane receptor protein involved in Fe transport
MTKHWISLSASCSLLALALPAYAQAVDPTPLPSEAAPASTQTDAAAGDGDIVVTGSRIKQRNLASVSPVIQASAEDLATRGTIRAEEFLNRLPQVQAAQTGSSTLRGITGTAQVDLRGLGPSRTLVLINGRRLPYGSPRSTPSDLNMVPTPLIKNVEVLTGGASAVYGSDAIAGVVNFTLQDNFDGIRVNTVFNAFQHDNKNETLQALATTFGANYPTQYRLPPESVMDGFGGESSLMVGKNFADGRGNITAYGTYREVSQILQGERDYSLCKLSAVAAGGYTCAPSTIGNYTTFAVTGVTGLPSSFRADGNQFVARNANVDRYNDQPVAQYQRPDRRYTFGANGHFDISEHFVPYFEAGYVHTSTNSDYSPSAAQSAGITSAGGINCDNPFLSAQQANYLCTSRGLSTASNYNATGAYVGPQSVATGVALSRRTYELGNRKDAITLASYRFVGGVKGKINDAFSYDASFSYSKVVLDRLNQGLPSTARITTALNAVVDRRTGSSTFGQTVCAVNADAITTNDDARCAPLDYFSTTGPSAAANNYIRTNQVSHGTTGLTDVLGTISGDLGKYGITSPFATTGIGIAIGFESRRNTINKTTDADAIALQEDFNLYGSTVSNEAFAEINVPLVQDKPFIKLLSFEGAYRYSKYKGSYSTDTYKLGGSWAPVNDIRFRGSYQRAVRVPTIIELFAGQTRQLSQQLALNSNGLYDPCAGANPAASAVQCARTGVTAAQYGTIADNNYFGALSGGNPNLRPETSDTYSVGVVLEPRFMPRFSLTVDAFDIRVDDLVGTVSPVLALNGCIQSGDPFFCNLIHRGTAGTLWSATDGYFVATNVNTGSLQTRGIDVTARYPIALGDLIGGNPGTLNLSLTGTYLDRYKVKPLPTSTAAQTYDCAGLYAAPCGSPRPKWRSSFVVDWQTPWNIDVTTTWRYVGKVAIAQSSTQTALAGTYAVSDHYLGSRSYFDLASAAHPIENLTLRAGVNNLFDRDPPLTATVATADGGMGNTYPAYYDTLGRYLFIGATIDF